eukprot:3217304-Prymnesium_polylepis.2
MGAERRGAGRPLGELSLAHWWREASRADPRCGRRRMSTAERRRLTWNATKCKGRGCTSRLSTSRARGRTWT